MTVRPDWLQPGCRVVNRNNREEGTVDRDYAAHEFWVAWDDGFETHADVDYWLTILEPLSKVLPVVAPTPEVKDTNPKDAIGVTKASLSCLPLPPLYEAALANLEGAIKYMRHNYREAGVRYSVYFDAMMRHLSAWYEGQDQAPDSKVHHLGHVMANCIILLDDILANESKGIDDRPPVTHDEGWLPRFSERVKEMLSRHPNPKPPCTER